MDDKVVIGGNVKLKHTVGGNVRLKTQVNGQANVVLVQSGGTFDHEMLIHRDSLDQHPIESISNLSNELSVRPYERLTNYDILAIINS